MYKNIFFPPAFTWDSYLSIKINICAVIRDYIPYGFNTLTKKTHIKDAKTILTELEITHPDAAELEIYLYIQLIRQELHNEKGEFKQRLDFCVQKMEEQNVFLKTLGVTGQTVKSIFG